MRRFRLFIATLSISSTVLFGLHDAVAQSIDAKSVERASLKYQSQKKLKKKSRKKAQALRNQKASENAAVKRRATKKNAAAKRNSTLQQTEIIAPWPVNKVSAVKPAEKKPTATFSGKVD